MRDHGLDRLLQLDGEVIVISDDGAYWVKFDVFKVEPSAARPHGVRYSLTLHGPGNERLVGFDNAHPAPEMKWSEPHDHHHVGRVVRPYKYTNAVTLLEDFWASVVRALNESGVK